MVTTQERTPSRDELFESLLRDEISMETLEEISDVKAWLATLHTRQLMGMRYGVWVANGLTDAQMHAMVKAELSTREHVPNKIEARRIRQERAKRRGVNRGSRR